LELQSEGLLTAQMVIMIDDCLAVLFLLENRP